MKRIGFICIVFCSIVAVGCSCDDTPSVNPTESQLVIVSGEVTAIDDRVPVDGGVTIDVRLADGGTERLLFGSLHTSPPPSQERLDLYDVIARLQVGDRVRATGVRVEGGIELESLVIRRR